MIRCPRPGRGFTLAELMVYLALVTGGIIVVGGLAVSAQRTVALQEALIDMNVDASRYLGALRRDVEAARKLDRSEGRLVVDRLDGVLAVYGAGTRVEIGANGVERGGEVFRSVAGVTFTAEGPSVVVELELSATFGWREEVRKRFRRVATPRRELERAR